MEFSKLGLSQKLPALAPALSAPAPPPSGSLFSSLSPPLGSLSSGKGSRSRGLRQMRGLGLQRGGSAEAPSGRAWEGVRLSRSQRLSHARYPGRCSMLRGWHPRAGVVVPEEGLSEAVSGSQGAVLVLPRHPLRPSPCVFSERSLLLRDRACVVCFHRTGKG